MKTDAPPSISPERRMPSGRTRRCAAPPQRSFALRSGSGCGSLVGVTAPQSCHCGSHGASGLTRQPWAWQGSRTDEQDDRACGACGARRDVTPLKHKLESTLALNRSQVRRCGWAGIPLLSRPEDRRCVKWSQPPAISSKELRSALCASSDSGERLTEAATELFDDHLKMSTTGEGASASTASHPATPSTPDPPED